MSERITRKQFEEMLMEPDLNLNSNARMILMAFACHNNYTENPRTVYKRKSHAGLFAGVNKDTAGDYIDALEADGFLIWSGEWAHGGTNKMKRYYLGRGIVETPILMRRKQVNQVPPPKKKKNDSDSVGPKTPTGSEPMIPTDSEPRLRPARHKQPLQQPLLNNPVNNPEADASEPSSPSLITEGNEVTGGAGIETDPSLIQKDEEVPVMKRPTKEEATPTVSESLDDYRELALANGIGPAFEGWLNVVGRGKPRAAFNNAMRQEGKK